MKNSFVLYNEYKEQFELLSYEEAGQLIMAIFEYTETGVAPELSGMVLMAFAFIKKQLDRDAEKYEKTVEKRKEAGKNGGAPKGNTNAQKQAKQANGYFDNQKQAKQANGYFDEQKQAKQPDNVDVNVNEDVDVDDDVDVNVNVNVDEDVDVNKKHSYQLIADMYNATCVTLPKCTTLSESRKKALRARLNHYSIDDFQRLFEKANKSSFLTGSNNNNWTANFDWLIKDSNMAKVLDGNYDNKPRASGGGGSGNPFMDMYYKLKEEEKNNDESGYSSDFGSF